MKSGVRMAALNALHFLFATQQALPRAEFKAMLGPMSDRLASSTLSALIERGFVTSDSAYGKIRFSVPRHALRFYFPALWPEAEQDEDLVSGVIEAQRAESLKSRRGKG